MANAGCSALDIPIEIQQNTVVVRLNKLTASQTAILIPKVWDAWLARKGCARLGFAGRSAEVPAGNATLP
jgi:hypothetical protein